jgi:hypothetical protein
MGSKLSSLNHERGANIRVIAERIDTKKGDDKVDELD